MCRKVVCWKLKEEFRRICKNYRFCAIIIRDEVFSQEINSFGECGGWGVLCSGVLLTKEMPLFRKKQKADFQE